MIEGAEQRSQHPPSPANDERLSLLQGLAQSTVLIVGLLTAVLVATGAPARFAELVAGMDPRSAAGLGVSATFLAAYTVTLQLIVVLAHFAIATFIFWRKRDDRMVLFVALTLPTNGALMALVSMQAANSQMILWSYLANLIFFLGLSSSVVLLYIFPNGRFAPRWSWLLALLWTGLVFLSIFVPNWRLSPTSWPRWLQILFLLIWTLISIAMQGYRFEQSATQVERQQVKWALPGLAAAAFGPLFFFLQTALISSHSTANVPNLLYQRMGGDFFDLTVIARLASMTLLSFLILLLPVTFAIAILRYRLWDIDIIIRRTLVYTALTAVLVLIYVSSIILLQSLFSSFIGAQSPVVIVVSTLLTVALFAPLRRRVQDVIDRRFFRQKYDAQQVLAAFAITARDETDLDALTTELARVVNETLQPAGMSVWLREPEQGR